MTHGSSGTVAVVGHGLDHDRHATRAVTFVAELFDVVAFVGAGTTGHGTIDDVAAHVGAQGLVQRQTQARVGCRVSTTLLGSDRQFADPLGEDLASLGILALFAVLDVCPLGMTSHNALRIL
ncbi:hypothetical protein D3C81_1214200 [compost metagenome]